MIFKNIKKNLLEKRYPQGSYPFVILKETKTDDLIYKVQVNTDKFYFYIEMDKNGKITKTEKFIIETPQPPKDNNDDF